MQASSRGLVDVSWFTRLAQRSPCKYAGKNKLTFCNLSKIRRYDVAWLFGDATVKRQLLRDFGLSAPYSQMSNLSHLSPTRIFPLILSENFTIPINSRAHVRLAPGRARIPACRRLFPPGSRRAGQSTKPFLTQFKKTP